MYAADRLDLPGECAALRARSVAARRLKPLRVAATDSVTQLVLLLRSRGYPLRRESCRP
jgi:hypothetical protein